MTAGFIMEDSAWLAVCDGWASEGDSSDSAVIPAPRKRFALRLTSDQTMTVLVDGRVEATLTGCGEQLYADGTTIELEGAGDGTSYFALDYVVWRKGR